MKWSSKNFMSFRTDLVNLRRSLIVVNGIVINPLETFGEIVFSSLMSLILSEKMNSTSLYSLRSSSSCLTAVITFLNWFSPSWNSVGGVGTFIGWVLRLNIDGDVGRK